MLNLASHELLVQGKDEADWLTSVLGSTLKCALSYIVTDLHHGYILVC